MSNSIYTARGIREPALELIDHWETPSFLIFRLGLREDTFPVSVDGESGHVVEILFHYDLGLEIKRVLPDLLLLTVRFSSGMRTVHPSTIDSDMAFTRRLVDAYPFFAQDYREAVRHLLALPQPINNYGPLVKAPATLLDPHDIPQPKKNRTPARRLRRAKDVMISRGKMTFGLFSPTLFVIGFPEKPFESRYEGLSALVVEIFMHVTDTEEDFLAAKIKEEGSSEPFRYVPFLALENTVAVRDFIREILPSKKNTDQ